MSIDNNQEMTPEELSQVAGGVKSAIMEAIKDEANFGPGDPLNDHAYTKGSYDRYNKN